MEHTIFKTIAENREALVLATIIAVKGSSPRHPGTAMLLGAESGRIGTIGGGKGELAALEACRRSLDEHRSRVIDVEMLGEDVAGPEMICGGVSTVLVECLDDVEPYRIALERSAQGERTLLRKRLSASDDGPFAVDVSALDGNGKPLHGCARGISPGEARELLGKGKPRFDGASRAYFEPVLPEEKLLILGGGHVGRALAAAAPAVGLEVTIVDDRPGTFADWNVPEGVQAVTADFQQAVREFPFDPATYAVVVTREHRLDLACLRALLDREYRYAGFMGSTRKVKFLLDQLLQDGRDPARVDALWAPIGLDIGAETPGELANAILGEIIAVRRQARTLPRLERDCRERRTGARPPRGGTPCA